MVQVITCTVLVVTQRLLRRRWRVIQATSWCKLHADNFVADAHKLSAKVKSEIPGREKQAEAKGEELAQRAGSKADELVSNFSHRLSPS